jgi:HEAT repeat protein
MKSPRLRRGKALAFWMAVFGLAVLVVAGITFRKRITEEYYLRRLATGDPDDQVAAAERLGELGSVRAVPLIVGAFRREVALHLATGIPPSTIAIREEHIGDRGQRLKRALVDIGKPATLDLLRVPMESGADFYTILVLQGIYADWERDLAAGGPPFLSYEILLRRLESDPTQSEEVRKEAALALLRKRRSR